MIRKLCVLTHLYTLASIYMKAYFDKVQSGANLGFWDNFAQELKNIYRQRGDMERAKKKLIALQINRNLVKKTLLNMWKNTKHQQELLTTQMKYTLINLKFFSEYLY